MDKFGRPSWDSFYMGLAFYMSTKSIDPDTKHGCVIISRENGLLSCGYNGPVDGIDDDCVRLTRPEKYKDILHSEENALISYNGSRQDINGATCYITGPPCHKCLRMLIRKGIKKIIHGKVKSAVIDASDEEAKRIMLNRKDKNSVIIKQFNEELDQECYENMIKFIKYYNNRHFFVKNEQGNVSQELNYHI